MSVWDITDNAIIISDSANLPTTRQISLANSHPCIEQVIHRLYIWWKPLDGPRELQTIEPQWPSDIHYVAFTESVKGAYTLEVIFTKTSGVYIGTLCHDGSFADLRLIPYSHNSFLFRERIPSNMRNMLFRAPFSASEVYKTEESQKHKRAIVCALLDLRPMFTRFKRGLQWSPFSSSGASECHSEAHFCGDPCYHLLPVSPNIVYLVGFNAPKTIVIFNPETRAESPVAEDLTNYATQLDFRVGPAVSWNPKKVWFDGRTLVVLNPNGSLSSYCFDKSVNLRGKMPLLSQEEEDAPTSSRCPEWLLCEMFGESWRERFTQGDGISG
ncbi:MAG: hypothetical protein Q9227_007097 [Pyrenula ochraceoflavens]